MWLTILYRNEAEKSALASVFDKVEKIEFKYVYFGNSKSVDEYKLKYAVPVAFLMKIFEILALLFRLISMKNLAFSTPHPSFRILRFIKPNVKLFFYIRTLHIIEENQSYSDKISSKSKRLSRSLNFLNNYFADYYFSPGLINNKFLTFKGVNENKIVNVGLHPETNNHIAVNTRRRIVIASQAWDAHGFMDTYTGEVSFISDLAKELKKIFANEFDIIIKLHPRERDGIYNIENVAVCRQLDDSLTSHDILIGGLSSYLIEQYLSGVKIIFFVHEKAFHYYKKPVTNFEIPAYYSVSDIVDVIHKITESKYSMDAELKFLKKAALPPIYINELS